MSYEGYEQKLCANGHYREVDAYAPEQPCLCGAPFVWSNGVDQTNGPSEGLIPRKAFDDHLQIAAAVTETCTACKHTSLVEAARYRPPTPEEERDFEGRMVYDEISGTFVFQAYKDDPKMEYRKGHWQWKR